MSHRLLRGTLVPLTTGLAAALTVLGVLGPAVAMTAGHGINARDQEWWLSGLHVTRAWARSEGSGIIVAVLGTGVDASYPGLAGSVITGPDYTGSGPSGRAPGSLFWGVQGTAVAGLIAAHEGGSGLVGVAPAAKILSVRVTLEFNDPLAADQAISRHLPEAIAAGIRYATDHGARIIDLPLDPGTLGLTSKGDPAAAGGSPAERAAVSYALSKGVLLVAPAGDDGEGGGIVNYPAAYPGVIAVGAIDRTGHLASFSSRRPYTSLTAPGVSLVTAAPPDSIGMISSTSMASGIVAGVAALVLSRFSHLTVAQVTEVLIESTATAGVGAGLPPLPARSATGAGYGTVDAIRALDVAAVITAENQPHLATPSAAPHEPARPATASPRRPAASTLAGSVLRGAVAGAGALIVLLAVTLLVMRSRRDRGEARVLPGGRSGAAARARTGGQHENRRPDRGPAATAGFMAAAGTRAPRLAPASRPGRGTGLPGGSSGPPWAPAPEPGRLTGPLPTASAGLPPPERGRGIRVPGDMATPPG